jgi:hypothetical protein
MSTSTVVSPAIEHGAGTAREVDATGSAHGSRTSSDCVLAPWRLCVENACATASVPPRWRVRVGSIRSKTGTMCCRWASSSSSRRCV